MSTRSAIAVPDGDSWKGRYCHSDGYPTGLIPALLGLHQIHGDDLAKFLTEDHCSWSAISADSGSCHCHQENGAPTPPQPNYWDGADIEFKRWVRPHPDNWDIEWVYVLNERGIFVLTGEDRHTDPTWRPLTFVPWSTTRTDWTTVECGDDLERCSHYCYVHFPDAPQESHRLGTAKYLGREPLDFEDALGFDWGGTYYRRTGSGRLDRWQEFGVGVVYGTKWFESVESPSGNRFDLHVWSNYKTVPRKLRKGIKLIFPPLHEEVSA